MKTHFKPINRIRRYMETENLENMSKTEKEAHCYRLLIERDKINERLREAQNSLKNDNGNDNTKDRR